jgi:NAD(P)-dependent dehydrogenase (short-subunit alcohol dehydrogenase family)
MNLQLRGKRALVTGSTAGIGLAIATALAREEAMVYVNGRTQSRVEKALQSVRDVMPGAHISGVAADLGTADGAGIMIAAVPEADILVNNVGIFEPKPFEEIPDDDWQRFFEVNVMSGVRLSRHYLPRMKAANWGRILFISSESGLQIPAEMIHYGMTKSAQIAIARGLAESVAGTGVTVNSVLPGPTLSEGVGTFVETLAAAEGVSRDAFEKRFFTEMRATSLIKRFLDPTEIADMVTFIASPLSSATNGAAIRVEGGILKSMA